MAQREQSYAIARTMHLPVDDGPVDPDRLILERVREQAQIVAWLRHEVQQLEPTELIRSARFSRRVETSAGAFPGTTTTVETGTQEHVLSTMYRAERKILDDVLAKAIAAGVARRHVELAEQQGELAGQLLTAVLRELGVDPASPRAQDAIRRHFTLLAGGAA
jgi:hypothetical protein